MPKLAIIATIEAVPGKRDQVIPLLKEHGARCLKDETGTLQFEIMVPRDDVTKIYLHEVYQDNAAFETHRAAASIARFRQETAGMIAKIDVTKTTPVE